MALTTTPERAWHTLPVEETEPQPEESRRWWPAGRCGAPSDQGFSAPDRLCRRMGRHLAGQVLTVATAAFDAIERVAQACVRGGH